VVVPLGAVVLVAVEHGDATSTLHGKEGSFVLQHSGTMNRGEASLTLTVVPDSGTGALTGMSGWMEIIVEGGKHTYRFQYALSEGS